ncbi:MAG: outer membrane protein assembly factor BamE [Oceanicoccus sp.]|jgi:outer membrane protein assembly factor BamE
MPKYIAFFITLLCFNLTGCSTLQFPGVYKITIEQGNIITQEMVDQLKPGMSKEQVEYIMGTAMIKDTFNAERWDYVYNIQRGKQNREQQRLSLFFKADVLDYFSGDFLPTATGEKETAAEVSSESTSDQDAG